MICNRCHGTGREPDGVAELASWCRARGHWVSPAFEVRTEAAAEILGVTPGTLRSRRCYGLDRLTPRRQGRHALYALIDLLNCVADEISRRRENVGT